MKNALVSILLFIILFSFISYADLRLSKLCDKVINDCSTLETLLFEKDMEKSYSLSVEIFDYIDKNSSTISTYINHQDYDCLSNDALRLALYIQENEMGDAMATLHVLRTGTKNMKDLQKINIKNIF